MDDLSQHLRAAVATPPPTRIDLDALIAADRRRRRHRTWTMAGTGAALAVAAVAVTPALLAGPGSDPAGLTLPGGLNSPSAGPSLCATPTPPASGSPAPLQTYDTVRARPTERPDRAGARLTEVLRPALDNVLPAGMTVDSTLPGCDLIQFEYERSNRFYEARARLALRGQVDNLAVTVLPTGVDDPRGCAAAPDPAVCTSSRMPDGGSLAVSSATPGDDGTERRWVQVQRADGTSVTVMTDNVHLVVARPDGVPSRKVGPPPVLTPEQLTAIATLPGLTLHP
ncbi:hypothetical protein DLJ47_30150 [Micromonospora sp. S4605]|uniref:hypothetical protein n=1 Tax=Micromonospora sp. S4605 TaxID=1420897 RepID=UPI000D6F8FE4|nr:hypothetical protein [Micromonospora sp. S4605]PWU47596.1 hypothetical protein DLJ47_30150 [Micromonospora sp. S4605]